MKSLEELEEIRRRRQLRREASHVTVLESDYLDEAKKTAHIVDEKIVNRVRAVVAEKLNCREREVTLEASFAGDLGADSLDLVELIMELEKEFDVSIPDEDASQIRTVGDAIRYIHTKL